MCNSNNYLLLILTSCLNSSNKFQENEGYLKVSVEIPEIFQSNIGTQSLLEDIQFSEVEFCNYLWGIERNCEWI